MSDPFIGEIRMFAGTFAPRNWAFCDGQVMSTNDNQALFSLLGTIYGGDGRTTYGLPDMRGRIPVHQGAGPGLTLRRLGFKLGEERVTLTEDEIPSHTHAFMASTQVADNSVLNGRVLGSQDDGDMPFILNPQPVNIQAMKSDSVASSGGNQSHSNMMPYLCLNFIIALQGDYPSRQ